MTKCNCTETNVDIETKTYRQLMKLFMCSKALKDIYENIPDEDRYASLIQIIGDRLDVELNSLMLIVLRNNQENKS